MRLPLYNDQRTITVVDGNKKNSDYRLEGYLDL